MGANSLKSTTFVTLVYIAFATVFSTLLHIVFGRHEESLPLFLPHLPDLIFIGISTVVVYLSVYFYEQRIRNVEGEHSSVLNLIPNAIITVDQQSCILYFNRAAQQMFGYAETDVIGKPFYTLIQLLASEPNATQTSSQLLEALKTDPQRIFIGVRRDDSKFFAELNLSRVRHGKQITFNMIVRDISERHTYEEALRESEARFRATFQNAGVGIVVSDTEGRIFQSNAAFQHMLRYDEDELRGMPFSQITYPADLDTNLALFGGAMAGEHKQYQMEKRYIRKDGAVIWVHLHVTVVNSADGKPHYGVGVIEDITARKQAEDALRESEERFRRMADQAPVIIWMMDEQGRSSYVNQRWLDLTGRTLEQELDDKWLEVVHPDDRDHCVAEWAAAYAERRPQGMEYRVLRHDGEYRTLLDNGLPRYNADGSFAGYIGSTFDITERKQMEDSLRESEQRFRRMADTTTVFIWIADENNNTIYFNQRWLDFTGRMMEQEWGKGWQVNIHPDDAERVAAECTSLIAARADFRSEFRLRRYDGVYRWVLDVGVPRYTPDGVFNGYIGSCVDITERKQMEDSLRESGQRFRLMADNAPVMVWLTDENEQCTYVNQRWLDFTGRTLEQELGAGWLEPLHPDDREKCEMAWKDAFSTKRAYHIEFRMRRHDGDYRTIVDTGIPRYQADGSFAGYIGSAFDITERKQMEDALRQSEERLMLALEGAEAGLWNWNVQTGTTYLLPHHDDPLGYSPIEIEPKMDWLMSIKHPDDRALVLNAIKAHLSGETALYQTEHRVLSKSGEWRWIMDRAKIVKRDEHGKPLLVAGTYSDITERKQMQEAIRDNELMRIELVKERELLDLKQRVTSMVSHEFRTPLTIILSSSEIVERYHGKMPIERQMVHIKRIQGQVHEMNAMIEDVLTIDRVQSGKLPFEPAPIDLEDFCTQIVERAKIGSLSQMQLIMKTIGTFEGAQADRKLLERILTNLLSNAIKYSPAGGEVSLELERSGTEAQIRVRDQGIGIPLEDLSRLFEPFHRAHNVGSIGGTGLGLSIVKSHVELHNGTIHVETQQGVGTVFTLRLPLFTEDKMRQLG